ncbi:MAG: hypothetical protein PHI97_27405 [Desulfobulbus sp.]|nr:hypothetical protein [Desulfobulbus sp.]
MFPHSPAIIFQAHARAASTQAPYPMVIIVTGVQITLAGSNITPAKPTPMADLGIHLYKLSGIHTFLSMWPPLTG